MIQSKVIAVSNDYLGPASERFIQRQAKKHLHKDLEDITKADLAKLIEWIRLSFAMLTSDSRMVEEYINRLEKIAKKGT